MRIVGLPRACGVATRLLRRLTERSNAELQKSFGAHFSTGQAEFGNQNTIVFDRNLKRKHRDRAAWLMESSDPLLETVTENLLDRLDDFQRTFPSALNLGGAFHQVRRLIGKRGGVEKMTTMDMSEEMILKSNELRAIQEEKDGNSGSTIEHTHVVGDEEFLCLGERKFDVIISSMGFHWINDLPGAMTQCRMALNPDGLFLGAMLGGETLKELRIACTVAQLEREGGISPRVSPLAQMRDAGHLLQRAGLALPTVDVDEYTVRYPCALDLIEHLRVMGEGNAVLHRTPILKRDTALATSAVYDAMFGESDGTVPATFQVIYMVGWSPAPSQQTPKRRGSATVSLQDLEKTLSQMQDGKAKLWTD